KPALRGICDVLPVAPAAARLTRRMRATGIDPVSRRFQHLDDVANCESLGPLAELNHNPLAGNRIGDKGGPAVVIETEALATNRNPVDREFHPLHSPILEAVSTSSTPAVKIIPSVLPADFARLGDECQALEAAGVDRIQFDVMDGRFVPNLTFGPDIIAAVRSTVSVPFEAHLMIEEPDHLISRFVEAGCGLIIVHEETCTHLHRTLSHIKELGAHAAVALNPHTPIDRVAHVLDLLDMALVMTVNPGFGGQNYIAAMEPKIEAMRDLLDTADHWVDLEVDGGISHTTVEGAARAGANVLISGSWMFRHDGGLGAAVSELRTLATAAYHSR
ncbi:MAG: ribulose-phosphate 3-epimerase, partial [Acidimicrobiales bacterium]